MLAFLETRSGRDRPVASLVGWRECPEPRHPWEVRRAWAFMATEVLEEEMKCFLPFVEEIYLAPSAFY